MDPILHRFRQLNSPNSITPCRCKNGGRISHTNQVTVASFVQITVVGCHGDKGQSGVNLEDTIRLADPKNPSVQRADLKQCAPGPKKRKNRRPNATISRMRIHASFEPIDPNIYMWYGVVDVINCAKFRENPSKCLELSDAETRRFPLISFFALTTVS